MASKFNRTSYLGRIGAGAGIGALALITGACSPGAPTDADTGVEAGSESETAVEAEPITDADTEAMETEADGEGAAPDGMIAEDAPMGGEMTSSDSATSTDTQ